MRLSWQLISTGVVLGMSLTVAASPVTLKTYEDARSNTSKQSKLLFAQAVMTGDLRKLDVPFEAFR